MWKAGIESKFIYNSFTLVMFVCLLIFFNNLGYAQINNVQRGIITGEVRDAQTQETLPGANVIIEGTTIGTATDIDGRYTLRSVPVGDVTVSFRYIGYVQHEVQVSVNADERVELNVELETDMIQGDEVFVVAHQRGQARALTRQRQSVNIRSVVSSEQMDRFGDQTVSGALQRIAGMGHGGTNIRGVGSAMSNVTMDGQRMGSTGSGDRSVDLGTISADMVQDLEVIKVITPDMDADALSGVININTRRPIGGERSINARIGGGITSRFVEHIGPSRRASFSYGDSPSNDFSYGINLSYLRSTSAVESFNTSWSTRNFTSIEGPSDVLSDFNTQMEMDPRERYGTALQFTFQPTDRTTYHIQGMFNYQDRNRMSHGKRYSISIDRYTSPNRTGPIEGNKDNIRYNSRLDDYKIHQYTFQAGARHLFDGFDMEYALGWGHGRMNQDRYEFNFNSPARYDYLINIDDRWMPLIEISPLSELTDLQMSYLTMNSGSGYRWDSHLSNDFKGNIDFEIPHRLGSFKFGSSGLMTFKSGNHERFTGDFDARVALNDFDRLVNADWRIFEREHSTYHIPWLIDLEKGREFYHSQRPHFNLNMETWARNSKTTGYTAYEHIFAGYGMANIEYGRITFLGGARLEHTITEYSGKEVTIDDNDKLRGVVDRIQNNSYINLFPNAQLKYAFGRLTNSRLAYSRSIGRPSYSQLAPNIERDYGSDVLTQGNPQLKPMVSHNLDLLFEHYFMDVGQLVIGFFYKGLSDFVYSYSDIIRPDGTVSGPEPDRGSTDELFVGWRFNTYDNGEEATVYGVEFTWQQNLRFLPGFLGNFGSFFNYSYAHSLADVGRRDTNGDVIYTLLQGQRPHVVNVGLDYSQGSFSGQLSYQWGAPSISSYGDLRFVPGDPNVPINRRVYFEGYRDAANDLTLTLRYRLTDAFRLWADANNILNHRRVDYRYHRDYYPTQSSLSGRTVNLGIRYSL